MKKYLPASLLPVAIIILLAQSLWYRRDKPVSPPVPVFCAPSGLPAGTVTGRGPLIPGFTSSHLPITTVSDSVGMFFDQGLSQLYAFNHGEAGRSFRSAISLDPEAAMPYWGMAMVMGPNYNAALDATALQAINALIDSAKMQAGKCSELEKGLINALDRRFPEKPVQDMAPYYEDYAKAMSSLYKAYPDDPEVAGLYIDAIMNEHPWNHWLKDGTPQPWTNEIVRTIESVLQRWPEHIGAIHYYIHAVEASKNAGRATVYADRLPGLAPVSGHLVHMPSHIYIRTGQYHKGVLVNEQAALADSSYISQCRVLGFYPMLLYPHNVHFLAACAFLEGNTRKAIDNAQRLTSVLDQRYLAGNITLQHFYSIPYYVMVHAGRWEDILRAPEPKPAGGQELMRYPSAIRHYARGMAFAAKGQPAAAGKELEALERIAADPALKSQLIWDLNTAADLVDIARLVLRGEILAHQRQYQQALPFLRQAVAIEDRLNYNEPPDWFFSTRLTLGHWLLQSGNWKESEEVFRKDLETFPENGWALQGLYRAQLGRGESAAAAETLTRFEKAWTWADIRLSSSRKF